MDEHGPLRRFGQKRDGRTNAHYICYIIILMESGFLSIFCKKGFIQLILKKVSLGVTGSKCWANISATFPTHAWPRLAGRKWSPGGNRISTTPTHCHFGHAIYIRRFDVIKISEFSFFVLCICHLRKVSV